MAEARAPFAGQSGQFILSFGFAASLAALMACVAPLGPFSTFEIGNDFVALLGLSFAAIQLFAHRRAPALRVAWGFAVVGTFAIAAEDHLEAMAAAHLPMPLEIAISGALWVSAVALIAACGRRYATRRHVSAVMHAGGAAALSAVAVSLAMPLAGSADTLHSLARVEDIAELLAAGLFVVALALTQLAPVRASARWRAGAGLRNPAAQSGALGSAPGRASFEWFRGRALRPDMICIDYGCGRLTVGRHFIRHLDSNCYVGLDFADRRFADALDQLGGDVVATKQPCLATISYATLNQIAECDPDLIYSTAMLKRLAPSELDFYFRSISRMLGSRGVAVLGFDRAERTRRTSAGGWAHSADDLMAAARLMEPGLCFAVQDAPGRADEEDRQSMLLVARSAENLIPWVMPEQASAERAARTVRPPLPSSMTQPTLH